MSPARKPGGSLGAEGAVLLAITPRGEIVARADGASFPPEGRELLDSRGNAVGQVIRVYGPVDRPYLTIRPRREVPAHEAARLIGSRVSEAR